MEKKDTNKDFSTCLEGMPFAGLMQKMIGRHGIGSICSEMMKKAIKKKEEGGSFPCAEMMKSMMKGCCDTKEETKEPKQEAGQ